MERIAATGLSVTTNDCVLLAGDLDRPPENVRGMCRDLLSLTQCTGSIIASSTRSTVADSLRGLGIRVYYTMASREFRYSGDDDDFEFHDASELAGNGREGTGGRGGNGEGVGALQSERSFSKGA
jgi:hypothetical protein